MDGAPGDLWLLVARAADGAFTIEARRNLQDAPKQTSSFISPVTERDHEDLRRYAEHAPYEAELGGGSAVFLETMERRLREIGEALSERVFTEGVPHNWLHDALRAGDGRLVIASDDPWVHREPWELLRVVGRPLHEHGIRLVRQVVSREYAPRQDQQGKGQLRVLLVVSRPDDVGFLDPRLTIREVLEVLEERPDVDVEFCRPATLEQLRAMLDQARKEERPYGVVHFDGHGAYMEDPGAGALLFERQDGAPDAVGPEKLGTVLREVPVPFLEACRTADVGGLGWEAVAPALLGAGVGTVVAMRYGVHVDMTRVLMRRLYEAVSEGATVGRALEHARAAVAANPYRRPSAACAAEDSVPVSDWFVPQLYQGRVDPKLVGSKPHTRAPQPGAGRGVAAEGAGAFPAPPRYGFADRPAELYDVERALLRGPAVTLCGMGGAGKTAVAGEAARWLVRTAMFCDGAVFVPFEHGGGHERAVTALGRHFDGIAFERLPADQKRRRAEEMFRTKDVLVVWDSFDSVLAAFSGDEGAYDEVSRAEVAALYNSWCVEGARGRLLLTSRVPEVNLAPLPTAYMVQELSRESGIAMMLGALDRLGLDRSSRSTRGITISLLEDLGKRLSWHALALELVVPSLAITQPSQVLAEVEDLLAKAKQDHQTARGVSLQASWAFSAQHLSPEAVAALPALRLLAGGGVESLVQSTVGGPPGAFFRIRDELEAVGILRTEGAFLRLHPTLSDQTTIPHPDAAAQERFLDGICALCTLFDQTSRNENAGDGMALFALHEAPVRRALTMERERGSQHRAAAILELLVRFFRQAGRGAEANRLVEAYAPSRLEGPIDRASAVALNMRAEALVLAGRFPEAEKLLEALVARLRTEPALAFALGMALGEQGRLLIATGRALDAVKPLREAHGVFMSTGAEDAVGTRSLAVTLGDLANAYRHVGMFDEAERAGREALDFFGGRGDENAVARTLVQLADVYNHSGRHAEAEKHYAAAADLAEKLGDHDLEGMVLQHWGDLLIHDGRAAEAAEYLHRAVEIKRESGDAVGVAYTCGGLGQVARMLHRPDEARAWFDKSLAIARGRGDLKLESYALNERALAWKEEGRFSEAAADERAALTILQTLGLPEPLTAALTNLAATLVVLGEVDEAEALALRALDISRRIGYPDRWKTLWVLENVAGARGDAAALAVWRKEKLEVHAHTWEIAGAGDPLAVFLQALRMVFHLAAVARRTKAGLPAEFFENAPPGMPFMTTLRTHLEALASGKPQPLIPDDIPPPLADLLREEWTVAKQI